MACAMNLVKSQTGLLPEVSREIFGPDESLIEQQLRRIVANASEFLSSSELCNRGQLNEGFKVNFM